MQVDIGNLTMYIRVITVIFQQQTLFMYHINKILLSLLLSICVTLSYSQEQHLATLIPAGGGHFPITNSQYLQGATKIAFDTTARNNIPSYYRDTTTFLCYTIVDSSLWILRNGIANSNYKKIATLSNIVGNVNTILNGGNILGVPIVIGSNDNKNVAFIRNGSTYLSLGGGREYFGTSQNYWVDTVGNMFGQLWKGLNSYTSTSLNIPYDTLPPPTGVWDTGYISLLATNRSDNHLWLRSGHENGTHNTIWKQIPLSSDLNGYGNTFSQGVIPTSSKLRKKCGKRVCSVGILSGAKRTTISTHGAIPDRAFPFM